MNKLAVAGVLLVVAAGLYVTSSSWSGFQKPVEEEVAAPKPELQSIRRVAPPETPEPASEPEVEVDKPEPLEAEMTLFVVADSAASVHVEGKTNLPAATLLQVSVVPDIRLGPATVREDGTFATKAAAIRKGGVYTITLRTDASDQPTRVNEMIGRKGEHLTGAFATVSGFVAQGKFEITGKPFRQLPVNFEGVAKTEVADE